MPLTLAEHLCALETQCVPDSLPPLLSASALKVHFIHIENEVISELRPIVWVAQGKALRGACFALTMQRCLHGAAQFHQSPSVLHCL